MSICFAMDQSGGMTASEWKKQKTFVNAIAKSINSGGGSNR